MIVIGLGLYRFVCVVLGPPCIVVCIGWVRPLCLFFFRKFDSFKIALLKI